MIQHSSAQPPLVGNPYELIERTDLNRSDKIESATRNRAVFNMASLLLFMTLVAIGLVIGIHSPGLGIFFAILALPPTIRTLLVILIRNRRDEVTSQGAKIWLFVKSYATTLAIVTSTVIACGIAAFIGLMVTCFSMMAGNNSRVADEMLGPVVFAFTVTAAIGCMIAAFIVVRLRWKVDTQIPQTPRRQESNQ
jgi:hypothetical protein